MASAPRDSRPRLGISACLLGEAVRHDGGHKREDVLVARLTPHVRWVPVCPEVEIGLGVPRAPLRLERVGGRVRLRAIDARDDHTEAMVAFAHRTLAALAALPIAGYVLKSRSPSCGLDVGTFDEAGRPVGRAPGLFAAALQARLPGMPIAEEQELVEPARLEAFLARVAARVANAEGP